MTMESNRQRKAHRKSRRGCGNCKLRRVKCDESKPTCQRCGKFGVICDYESNKSSLRLAANGEMNLELEKMSPSINQMIATIFNGSMSSGCDKETIYQLKLEDMELIDKFHRRTIVTLGTYRSYRVFQNYTIPLASSHSFLMHIILTLVLMHDRHIAGIPASKRSTAEAYHWYRGTSLFKSKLSKPIDPDERDSLWVASAILGAIALFNIEADAPEQSWPIKKPCPNDLDWLRMSEGKKEVWRLCDPMRHDSILRPLVSELRGAVGMSSYPPNLDSMPTEFNKLYELDKPGDDNPYYEGASIITNIFPLECNHSNCGNFLWFVAHLSPTCRRLMERKDPRAILLLAYWCSKLCRYQWWIKTRASLEGRAICLYLERYHADDLVIQRLLESPKKLLGLDAINIKNQPDFVQRYQEHQFIMEPFSIMT